VKRKSIFSCLLAISVVATACFQNWRGLVCEETSGTLDCDGSHASLPNATFALSSGNKSFRLASSQLLSNFKGLRVSVRGTLDGNTIHVTSIERENLKDTPSREAGNVSSVTPNSDKTGACKLTSGPAGFGTEDNSSPLTNSDVVKLKKMGVADDTVIECILKADKVHFDTDHEGLVALYEQGIADNIVDAMKARKDGKDFSSPAEPQPRNER